jgi:hypothetical protein
MGESKTTRRKPEDPEVVAARSRRRLERLAASGGRQVAVLLDPEAAAVLTRIEAQTGFSPRALFSRLLRHPEIDRLVDEVRDVEAPGLVSEERAKAAAKAAGKVPRVPKVPTVKKMT